MFGQYASTGGRNRTKADLVNLIPPHHLDSVVWSRKPGKNRLHYKTADGGEHYILHETVIASLSPCRQFLTLDDGGWATLTTRRAMGEAAEAMDLPRLSVAGGLPRAANVAVWGRWGDPASSVAFDRRVTLRVLAGGYVPCGGLGERIGLPMVRAHLDGGSPSLEVRYERGHIVTDGGERIKVGPTSLLLGLYRMRRLASKARRHGYGTGCEAIFGRGVEVGRFGRTIHVGCHTFKAQDISAVIKRLEADYPTQAKVAHKRLRAMVRREQADAKRGVAQRAPMSGALAPFIPTLGGRAI